MQQALTLVARSTDGNIQPSDDDVQAARRDVDETDRQARSGGAVSNLRHVPIARWCDSYRVPFLFGAA
jgi:hypothetical protein